MPGKLSPSETTVLEYGEGGSEIFDASSSTELVPIDQAEDVPDERPRLSITSKAVRLLIALFIGKQVLNRLSK